MGTVELITLGIAVLGAGLGLLNTYINFRRDVPRLQVTGFVQEGDDGVRRLRIKAVNTGRIPMTIEKVFLTKWGRQKPKAWQLWEHNRANARLPVLLKEGEAVTVRIHLDAVDKPFVHKCFTVMAQTAEGRRIKGRSTGLREFAVEAQALALKADQAANG